MFNSLKEELLRIPVGGDVTISMLKGKERTVALPSSIASIFCNDQTAFAKSERMLRPFSAVQSQVQALLNFFGRTATIVWCSGAQLAFEDSKIDFSSLFEGGVFRSIVVQRKG